MDLRHALHHKNPQERAFIAKKRPDPSVMHACYASASESMLIFPWSTSKWCKNKSADFTLASFLPSFVPFERGGGSPKRRGRKNCPRQENDTYTHNKCVWVPRVTSGPAGSSAFRVKGPLSCGAPRPRPHQCQRAAILGQFSG